MIRFKSRRQSYFNLLSIEVSQMTIKEKDFKVKDKNLLKKRFYRSLI